MQLDFDNLFANLFPTAGTDADSDQPVSWHPKVDVVETSEAYELAVDMPGVHKEDIQINFHEGMLSISGERKARSVEETDQVVRIERQDGRFYRSFSLPNKINAKKIDARIENGVLFVTVPKLEESKPQRIEIL